MKNLIFWTLILYVIAMTSYAVWAEKQIKTKDTLLNNYKKLLSNYGYKLSPRDGDKDGFIQDGTNFERPIS